jgi:hypothetical protein
VSDYFGVKRKRYRGEGKRGMDGWMGGYMFGGRKEGGEREDEYEEEEDEEDCLHL